MEEKGREMNNPNEADDVPARGPKYLQVLSSLPEPLRPIYKALVEEYKFYALTHYGKAWVAYEVIADLVKSGWRRENSNIMS
jgi:hypothetical protein